MKRQNRMMALLLAGCLVFQNAGMIYADELTDAVVPGEEEYMAQQDYPEDGFGTESQAPEEEPAVEVLAEENDLEAVPSLDEEEDVFVISEDDTAVEPDGPWKDLCNFRRP